MLFEADGGARTDDDVMARIARRYSQRRRQMDRSSSRPERHDYDKRKLADPPVFIQKMLDIIQKMLDIFARTAQEAAAQNAEHRPAPAILARRRRTEISISLSRRQTSQA